MRQTILDIAGAAVSAVEPHQAVMRRVSLEGSRLLAGGGDYDLDAFERVVVVGAGKASAPMAVAVEDILGDRIDSGVVVVKDGHAETTRTIEIVEAGHPEPDRRGEAGARKLLDLVKGAGPDALVIALMSGGGSALLPLYPQGVGLDDMRELTRLLLRCGATIGEINTVRKHLSLIQGGRLAQVAGGAGILALLVSDVVGNPLDIIASGPTTADTSTYEDALGVLRKYDISADAPPGPMQRLRRGAAGEIQETPKPGDPALRRVRHVIVADNDASATAAAKAAHAAGFDSQLVTTHMEGEAREVARLLAGVAKDLVFRKRPIPPPACLIFGGETTVTVSGSGKGGRNQEMALAAAIALQGIPNIAVLCLGTDGNDGPTDAAGGLIDGDTIARGEARGMDARSYLADNNSYEFLSAAGDLVVTGPTRTNVNDLALIFSLEG
ncbi:MAG: glycerate kinase [Chloroflexi bacterium]|nr:glycerate kinase [Chloroflexota bacterium]MCY3937206.1 glycerate kinase [Chloroflexota bacterium]